MTTDEIVKGIIVLLTEQGYPNLALNRNTRLEEHLGMDPADLVNFCAVVEEHYGIHLTDHDVESITTIGQLADAVWRAVAGT